MGEGRRIGSLMDASAGRDGPAVTECRVDAMFVAEGLFISEKEAGEKSQETHQP
jgi:hypothetical protein